MDFKILSFLLTHKVTKEVDSQTEIRVLDREANHKLTTVREFTHFVTFFVHNKTVFLIRNFEVNRRKVKFKF